MTDRSSQSFDQASLVRGMTSRPGVYRMLDADGTVLYVGKAGDLRKRVASYFTRKADESPRIRSMVRQVRSIEVTVTRNEAEALLLESSLIKKLKPRYNVLFRDDKSYPFIQLSEHAFPRLSFYRGSRRQQGRYFGPYPNAGAVRRTLNLIQKLFGIRQCSDSFFRNRSRPCLQYQIKRCSAPCVGYISESDYRRDVEHAVLFLEGRNEEVIEALMQPMQEAADRLDYERAAQYRDQIKHLRKVQAEHQRSDPQTDLDVIACATRDGAACVELLFVRNGVHIGQRSYFPRHARDADCGQILSAFVQQYYLDSSIDKTIPGTVVVSHAPDDRAVLQQVLGERAGHTVRIVSGPRGARARWLRMAQDSAALALGQQLGRDRDLHRRVDELQKALRLPEPPQRLECFDISHTGGEAAIAACVVFGPAGPIKDDYRRFNIRDITPGDDYAAMAQAIQRRYTRLKKEEGRLPDMLLIDGGRGQVRKVLAVLEELQVTGVYVLGVAKGPGRRPGLETLILNDGETGIRLTPDAPALHLIQQIRDEAHRFAIHGHRAARGRVRRISRLEQIEGVGVRRRQQLIRYFGGLQEVSRAGVEELARVPGINRHLAQRIYDSLHGGD